MNEIKKCPFCGWDAQIQINVRNSYVNVELLCNGCDAIFKCSQRLDEELMKEKTIPEVVNECLSDVLERWNKRAEEPHKESRVEQILKRTIFPNKPFCTLAYNDKHGKGCKDLDCCECEFNNVTETAKYLLAPHED